MCDKKSRLLIIDDEFEIRNVLQEYLSGSYQCVAVESAEGALEVLATQPFDLIMSDIGMSAMSGIEMVPHIMSMAPDSIVIMISGQRTIEFAIDAMRAGAFDYITKPFELGDVAIAVRRALDHSRRRKERPMSAHCSSEFADGMRRGLKKNEFVVHYQPKVAIESGTVVGAEALVRWDHPELGSLLPADFVTEAEESGLIVALGASVLRTACAQARRWHDAGLTFLHVAVNVSPRQFQEDDLFETVMRTLRETHLDAEYLQLELTETALMEHAESAVNVLRKLREVGVKIAIDDFGTGYSSLGYLKRLPIDFVKLDRSFVAGSATCPEDAALVMGSITLAHNLGLKVIAEGVESEGQCSFLRLVRCDEGQGYFFGKPTKAELFSPFLNIRGPGGSQVAESEEIAKQLVLPISSRLSSAMI